MATQINNRDFPYNVEMMRRTPEPKWVWEMGSRFQKDAIREAGERNRTWLAGEAIHRVVETETGKEIYRRGYLNPCVRNSAIQRSQVLKGSQ